MEYGLDILTTCIHHSELHFTDHWHTQTCVLSPLQPPLPVSWQRLLPREILQLPSSRHCLLVNTPHLKSQLQLPNSQLTAHLELRNSTADSQINSSLQPLCMDWTENTTSNYNAIVVGCLLIRCLETGCITPSFYRYVRYLATAGLQSQCLTGLYATISLQYHMSGKEHIINDHHYILCRIWGSHSGGY
jgi:hypothetical protein